MLRIKTMLAAIFIFCISFLFTGLDLSFAQSQDKENNSLQEEVLEQNLGQDTTNSEANAKDSQTKKKRKKKKGKNISKTKKSSKNKKGSNSKKQK